MTVELEEVCEECGIDLSQVTFCDCEETFCPYANLEDKPYVELDFTE